MIKFHYHAAPRDLPRIDVRKGDLMCHVYSDVSLDELLAWGRDRGLGPTRVHHSALPHFDAFGAYLEACGPGVGRRELVEDIRAWRERAGRSTASRQ